LLFTNSSSIHQARVVRKVDNALHRINHYPVDSVVCFVDTYRLDNDLSGGYSAIHPANNRGQEINQILANEIAKETD